VRGVFARFRASGVFQHAAPFGGGYINESFLVTAGDETGARRYVLQCLNDDVFRRPALVMENVQRVTQFLRVRLEQAGAPDAERRALRLIPTREREPFLVDVAGSCWRLYAYVERTHAHGAARTPAQAFEAGRAFGEFQRLMADYDGPRLHETIPRFHDTPARVDTLRSVIAADPCGRAATAGGEIDFALGRAAQSGLLEDALRTGDVPERIAHNDAKFSNVLLDDDSEEAMCVVDLDTVMPGTPLYDFGDMTRSMTSAAEEDDPRLEQVAARMPCFEALARGYLSEAGAFLTPTERDLLVAAGREITYEQGVRFLTDHLDGDRYYKTWRADHNLERARNQFQLLRSLESLEGEMAQVVART